MAKRIGIVKLILSIAFLIVLVQLFAMFHFSSRYVDTEERVRRKIFDESDYFKNEDENEVTDMMQITAVEKLKSDGISTPQRLVHNYSLFQCEKELDDFHKDAKSAYKRAKTDHCKHLIYKTACLNEADKLFWKNITRSCPVDRSAGRPAHKVEAKEGYGPPIRILYAMVVHGRALRQVKRLFKAVFHTNHYFYFHVDSRSDYLYREVQQFASQFSNVKVAPWRQATIWGGASLLQVLLRMMADTVNIGWKWDFFINLSAACYPVQTDKHLSSFLRSHRDENFLKPHGGSVERFVKKQGVSRTFLQCEERMWRLGERKLPDTIDFDGGSDWIVLNRQFVEYVVNSQDTLVLGLKHLYTYALLPAEEKGTSQDVDVENQSFFHVVLRNSKHCTTYAKGNLRLTNWKRKLGCRCQYKHIVDWCGCSPNDFKPEDLVRLQMWIISDDPQGKGINQDVDVKVQSQQLNHFARKFEPIVNNEIINLLDFWLYGKPKDGTPGTDNYWENFYNAKDDKIEKFDVFMTALQSFARIAANALTLGSGCRFSLQQKAKEATYLTVKDFLNGVLTLFDVEVGTGVKQEYLTMETYFKPRNLTSMLNRNMSSPANRLKGLDVGIGWDQKERIFRNIGSFIGPNDRPTLVHRWVHGDEFHVRIVWQDPLNVIAGMYQMKVEKNWVISFHKPTFNKPLRPGTWTVKIVYNGDIVLGQVKFLVIPQAYIDGKELTLEQAVANNNGPPAGLYSSDFVIEFDRDATDTRDRVKEFSTYSSSIGTELEHWVDKNIQNHWDLKETCISRLANFKGCGTIPLCQETDWSSKSPDPKSHLGSINEEGRLR